MERWWWSWIFFGFVAEILFATSAVRPRADVAYCIHALSRRLAKTRNWTVGLIMIMMMTKFMWSLDWCAIWFCLSIQWFFFVFYWTWILVLPDGLMLLGLRNFMVGKEKIKIQWSEIDIGLLMSEDVIQTFQIQQHLLSEIRLNKCETNLDSLLFFPSYWCSVLCYFWILIMICGMWHWWHQMVKGKFYEGLNSNLFWWRMQKWIQLFDNSCSYSSSYYYLLLKDAFSLHFV